jgi:Chlorite dismutase
MHNRYAFIGGNSGKWRVSCVKPVRGEPLSTVPYLEVAPVTDLASGRSATWILCGLMSNLRYATRAELTTLKTRQEPLGRPLASQAALIPIKKTSAWWDLAQDERRAIFEERSRHTAIGLEYLPAVARQLYHCRDLQEPFDFLTWFEYAPEHADTFENLVARLRSTSEWGFVEREIDIRLELDE